MQEIPNLDRVEIANGEQELSGGVEQHVLHALVKLWQRVGGGGEAFAEAFAGDVPNVHLGGEKNRFENKNVLRKRLGFTHFFF